MRALSLSACAFSFCVLLAACDSGDTTPQFRHKMVPDGTPFIVATLEATPDTVHYHPQVYVGSLSDPQDFHYNLFADAAHKPGNELWMPTFFAQVAMLGRQLNLRPTPDERASVTVTGPLGMQGEATVAFAHERRGAYGDLERRLVQVARGRYRLDVTLGDGRRYTATTQLPGMGELTLPDTTFIPVRLEEFENGSGYYETHDGAIFYPVEYGEGAVLSVCRRNMSLEHDRILFGLGPGEEFPYQDRGQYLSTSGVYLIATNATMPEGLTPCGTQWTEGTGYRRFDELPNHFALLQMNADLARYYIAEDFEWSHPHYDPYSAEQLTRQMDAGAYRDSTFLPSISNIYRVGTDGRALPKEQSDAVGVFGGYTARYAKNVMVPVRSWDPDSLGWTLEGPTQPAAPAPDVTREAAQTGPRGRLQRIVSGRTR